MGSAASKVKPSSRAAAVAGGRPATGQILPSARPVPPPPTEAPRPPPKASGSKTAAIDQDGQDPTFAKALEALGQVAVQRPPAGLRPPRHNRMLDILARRKETEDIEEQSLKSRPSAQGLSNLLDEIKSAKTRQEAIEMADEYGIDIAVVEELSKHLNAPSVSKVNVMKKEVLEEIQIAKWVNPPNGVLGGK